MHHLGEIFCMSEYGLRLGVLASMFLGGALGGIMHCTGMCGGFGLSFASARYAKISPQDFSEQKRFLASSLLPYHFGRITTYSLLGLASGYLGSLVSSFEFFNILRDLVLILAILIFITAAFSLLKLQLPFGKKYTNLLGKYSNRFFAKPEGSNLFFAGVVLGFLPCALVYSALLAAAASASPITGAAIVAAFGFGTMLPLILTTYGFGYFVKKFKAEFKKTFSVLMAINSLVWVLIMIF
jgi:sulfite exporter TauE/SafE